MPPSNSHEGYSFEDLQLISEALHGWSSWLRVHWSNPAYRKELGNDYIQEKLARAAAMDALGKRALDTLASLMDAQDDEAHDARAWWDGLTEEQQKVRAQSACVVIGLTGTVVDIWRAYRRQPDPL